MSHTIDYVVVVLCIWMCSGVRLRGEGEFGASIVRLTQVWGSVESRQFMTKILVGFLLHRYTR